MSEYTVLRKVSLQLSRRPSKGQSDFLGRPRPVPVELQIVSYPAQPGFYLFYLDALGNVESDTYHDTLQDALDEAALVFGVTSSEWELAGEARKDSRSE